MIVCVVNDGWNYHDPLNRAWLNNSHNVFTRVQRTLQSYRYVYWTKKYFPPCTITGVDMKEKLDSSHEGLEAIPCSRPSAVAPEPSWFVTIREGLSASSSKGLSLGFEAANISDITVSLAWCPYDSNVLITGQGPKYIRAFDIRGEQSVKLVGWSSVISRHIHNYAIDTALYGLISWIIHTIWLVHTYDLLDNRHIDDITINKILLLYHIKLIDSILLWVCTMVDHRKIVEIW